MTNFFKLYYKYFELIQNFTTEHVKIYKNPAFPVFFSDFCSKF